MEYTKPEAVWKRNSRTKESEEQRQTHLSCDKERKWQKRAAETDKQHNSRLASIWEKRTQKRSTETNEEWEHRLNTEKERKRAEHARNDEQIRDEMQLTDVVWKPLGSLSINNISTHTNQTKFGHCHQQEWTITTAKFV